MVAGEFKVTVVSNTSVELARVPVKLSARACPAPKKAKTRTIKTDFRFAAQYCSAAYVLCLDRPGWRPTSRTGGFLRAYERTSPSSHEFAPITGGVNSHRPASRATEWESSHYEGPRVLGDNLPA